VPGDEFALHESGLLCREDHQLMDREDNNNIAISLKEEEFRYSTRTILDDIMNCTYQILELEGHCLRKSVSYA
jgi:hypothetical protein